MAKAASFAIVGVLAVKLAVGHGGKATSREGALQTLAQHTVGKVLLALLAFGFAAYASWRLVQAFAERDDRGEQGALAKWGKRAGYTGRGLVYSALTFAAIRIIAGSRGTAVAEREGAADDVHRARLAGRRWIVGRAGVAWCRVACVIQGRQMTRTPLSSTISACSWCVAGAAMTPPRSSSY